jgi:hypothetical protein
MVYSAGLERPFHFWNLEQSSTEKAGIQPTYHEHFQEVVTDTPFPVYTHILIYT